MLNLSIFVASLTWETIFSSFSSAWTSVMSFIATEPVLIVVIGVPIGCSVVAVLIALFKSIGH